MGKRTFSPRNDILNAWAMTVVLWAALLVAVRHRHRCRTCVIQAVFAFCLLEAVNYLEHYGLMRQQLRQRPMGAGDPAAQLEQQQRHDEPVPLPPAAAQRSPREPDPALPGAAALRGVAAAAQRLRVDDRAGYFPPLWRRVMDTRVLAHYGGDVTLANIHPRSARRCWRSTAVRGSDTLAA